VRWAASVLAVEWLDVPRSLREGFLHVLGDPVALVLGFGLSGAVQAFVPNEQMERVMATTARGFSGAGQRPRDGLVVVFLRGDGDGEVAVPEGR